MKLCHLTAIMLALISGTLSFVFLLGRFYNRNKLKLISFWVWFWFNFYCVDTCLLSYRWSNQSFSLKWIIYSDSST